MALAANEIWYGGFVRDSVSLNLVITRNTVGAQYWGGFLRDPDGRLVVTS